MDRRPRLVPFCLPAFLLLLMPVVSAAEKKADSTQPLDSAPVRWSDGGAGGTPAFTRHVVPLLGKLGCNNRACHGSFQGQNGFRLSLFGHDAGMDFSELTSDEGKGPRINTKNPEKSLALRKPTGQEDHEGGDLFKVGSWQHRLLLAWIADGAKYDRSAEPTLERLEISPTEIQFSGSSTQAQLRLVAHFSDKSIEDVTPLTLFSTNDDTVAKVDDRGEITRAGNGDTSIVATFAGVVVTSQVIVPHDSGDLPFPSFAHNNRVDALVEAKLRKVNIHPSELSADADFLRRVYLDVIGTLPTADEAKSFLDDSSGDKRARLIDGLLDRPEYAMYWATRFSDWTGNDSRFTPQPRSKTAWLWYDWLHDKLARNVPYDEVVGGFITATSREGRSPESFVEEHNSVAEKLLKGFDDGTYAKRQTNDMYWRKAGNGGSTLALQAAYAFMGVRLECAQCHKHPFDRWTQDDFKQFTNFFTVVGKGVSKDVQKLAPKPAKGNNNAFQFQEIHISNKGGTAKLLGGAPVKFKEDEDPRVALWQWLRSPETPYLSQAIANRLWGHYFGVGIVQPVDDFNAANPPSNPQLIEWLARDFVEHKFDLKHLHRTILNSRTYQLSWRPNETNKLDNRNFSHAQLRRMPAEVVVDALNQITGTTDRYAATDAPEGTRAIGLAPSRLRGNGPEYALGIFGRPLRTQTCDCERSGETGLAQALYLLNDVEINNKIADPKGQLAGLLEKIPDNQKLIETLYLLALSRYPSEDERQRSMGFVDSVGERQAGMQDLLWSLVNLREFIFLH